MGHCRLSDPLPGYASDVRCAASFRRVDSVTWYGAGPVMNLIARCDVDRLVLCVPCARIARHDITDRPTVDDHYVAAKAIFVCFMAKSAFWEGFSALSP